MTAPSPSPNPSPDPSPNPNHNPDPSPYTPPLDSLAPGETYRPLRQIPCRAAWCHTHPSTPGLFEYVSAQPFDGIGEPSRFLAALQPLEECEAPLCAQEAERAVKVALGEDGAREGSKEVKISSNVLPAVGEGEDRLAVHAVRWEEVAGLAGAIGASGKDGQTVWGKWAEMAIIPESTPGEGPDLPTKDLLFCSIFDGHSGASTADLLQRAAHTLLACGLSASPAAVAGDEEAISQTIKDVYLTLSQDISAASASVLISPRLSAPGCRLPNLPSIAQLHLGTLEMSGACAATALIDLRGGKVYVAHLGDVRIVGIYTIGNGDGMKYRAEVLTGEDHNGFVESEVQRVKAAHPDDPNAMIPHPPNATFFRVLGTILVSRAVGDVSYNRPEDERQQMIKAGVHPVPVLNNPSVDPPYIEWEPTVSVHPLVSSAGERLTTLMIASDGLWDKLTTQEAALGYLAHRHTAPGGTATHQDLAARYPLARSDTDGEEGETERTYIFQDFTPATHLIRMAIGDGNSEQCREMLSLRHGTREFRDDTAVMIIDLESVSEGE